VPTPPRPVLPKPVTDLAARQQGSSVILTFTLPKKSDENETLAERPSVEIFRGERESGAAAKMTTQLIYTVPSTLVDTYLKNGLIEFRDPLKAASLHGQDVVYMVRTRASTKRASADSNVVSVRTLPVPPAPIAVHVTALKETSIELAWTASRAESANGGGIAGYHVYRGELAADAPLPTGDIADTSKLKMSVPPALLGPAVGCWRARGVVLDGSVQPLVPAILLRLGRLDSLRLDTPPALLETRHLYKCEEKVREAVPSGASWPKPPKCRRPPVPRLLA